MIAFIIFLEKFLLKPNKSSRAGVRGVRAPARCDSGSAIALPSTGVCKMGLLLVCFFFFLLPGRFNVEAHALGTCSSLG